MKVQNKTIAVVTVAAALFSGSAFADDVNSVIDIQQVGASVNVNAQNNVNPKVTIQDYVDAANQENVTNYIVDTRSRWEAEQTL